MPASFYVRRLRAIELDRILFVEHASFGHEAYDRNLFANYLARYSSLFLVAARGEKICGYCITAVHGERAELVSIAVAPEYRRNGAARALLESTLRRLKRRAVQKFSLTVKAGNQPARTLYEGYGFVKTRTVRHYYEDGADGIRMVKHLN